MQQVKSTYNGNYTIDAVIQSKEPGKITEGYYRTNIKNNKWKLEASDDEGTTFNSTMLYDGKEILIYSPDSPYAMINPISMVLNMTKEQKEKEFLINIHNPITMLVNWEKDFNINSEQTSVGEFVNNRDSRNGFSCRLIQFGSEKEVCAYYHMI